MFAIIFCFLPILFMGFQLFLLKKRTSLGWEIKKGQVCYNCKEDLNLPDGDLWNRLMKSGDYSKICISCSRDRKISLLRNPLIKWKFKIQKMLITDKLDKMNWIFLTTVFFFIISDVVLKFMGVNLPLWIVYGSLNFIWWVLLTWKTLYTTIKKPSE
jgi:hypothetical protein